MWYRILICDTSASLIIPMNGRQQTGRAREWAIAAMLATVAEHYGQVRVDHVTRMLDVTPTYQHDTPISHIIDDFIAS